MQVLRLPLTGDCDPTAVLLQVALADAAIVTGLHIGAKLPLSVSFAIAVAANMVLVLLLLGLLVAARMANAANNSRLAEAANSPEVRGTAGVRCAVLLCAAQGVALSVSEVD